MQPVERLVIHLLDCFALLVYTIEGQEEDYLIFDLSVVAESYSCFIVASLRRFTV